MSDPDSTVYTDPQAPGAPRVGDVVVVVAEHPPGVRPEQGAPDWIGAISVLEMPYTNLEYLWAVQDPGLGPEPVYAVRYPTEAELATYHLHGPQVPT